VYFPDTIPATADVESFGPAEWSAEREDGGATLEVTYPLIPFGNSNILVPPFDIVVGPTRPEAVG
jgi:hypothetical protein